MRIVLGVLGAAGLAVLLACGGGSGGAKQLPEPAGPRPRQAAGKVEPAGARPVGGPQLAREGRPRAIDVPDGAEIKAAAGRIADEQDELRRRINDRLDELAPGEAHKHARRLIGAYLEKLGRAGLVHEPAETLRLADLRLEGKEVNRWRAVGAADVVNTSGLLSDWELHLVCVGTEFLPVACWLNANLVFEDSSYGSLETAAEKEKADARRAERRGRRENAEAVARAKADARSDEDKAAAALAALKPLIEAGKKAAAKRRLEELIEKFPDTLAADEARELVKSLTK